MHPSWHPSQPDRLLPCMDVVLECSIRHTLPVPREVKAHSLPLLSIVLSLSLTYTRDMNKCLINIAYVRKCLSHKQSLHN